MLIARQCLVIFNKAACVVPAEIDGVLPLFHLLQPVMEADFFLLFFWLPDGAMKQQKTENTRVIKRQVGWGEQIT